MQDSYTKALNRIKDIVDAYKENKIHITIGNNDFDKESHTYDISVIIGIVGNHIDEAMRDKS